MKKKSPIYMLPILLVLLWTCQWAYTAPVSFSHEQKMSRGEAWPSIQSEIFGNQAGEIYLAWGENDGVRDSIVLNSSSDRGVNWFPEPVIVHSQQAKISSQQSNFQICGDDYGHVYAIWIDFRYGSEGEIYFNYSSDYGQSWQSQDIRLNRSPLGKSKPTSPRIACDQQGHVYALWLDSTDDPDGEIYWNYSSDYGQSWQSEDLRLDHTPDHSAHCLSPRLVCHNNKVLVAWIDNLRPDNPGLYFNYSSDFGSSWQDSDSQLASGGSFSDLQLIWGSNSAHFAWIKGDNQIYFQDQSKVPVQVNSGSSAPCKDLRLAADSQGHAYLIWLDKRLGKYHLYENHLQSPFESCEKGSGQRIDLGSASSNDCFFPSLSCNDTGLVVASWTQNRGRGLDFFVNYADNYADSWPSESINVTDSQDFFSSSYSKVYCEDNGDIYSIWLEQNKDIYFKSFVNTDGALEWTGESGFSSDGVNPDVATGGSDFEFRVKYSSLDDDKDPNISQIWVDENDDGIYEPAEKHDLEEADSQSFSQGRTYKTTLRLRYSEDSEDHLYSYRFYFVSGANMAIGEPAVDHLVSVDRPAFLPTLSWDYDTSGYSADGVEPDAAQPDANRVFRVAFNSKFSPADIKVQVWIDANASSGYEESEKHDMKCVQESGDKKVYEFSIRLAYAGDGEFSYRFFAYDPTSFADGEPTQDHPVIVNAAPNLCWEKDTGYDKDPGENFFTFRVIYQDDENDPPTVHRLWIDRNHDGEYQDGESYNMEPIDANEPCDLGRVYTTEMFLLYEGQTDIPFRFDFKDSYNQADPNLCEANFSPAGQLLTLQQDGNIPVLDWVGDEEEYKNDGVERDPNTNTLTFRIKYTDYDGDEPGPRYENWVEPGYEVWVDLNDNGVYDPAERFLMDVEKYYQAGKAVYTRKIFNVLSPPDGELKYRFYFHDGQNLALGEGSNEQTILFPMSSLQGLAMPEEVDINQTLTFRVKYVSLDNKLPTKQMVWLDENDNGIIEENEKHSMDQVSPDPNCINGKDYQRELLISYAGDGQLQYRFIFENRLQGPVLGEPAQIHTLKVNYPISSRPVLEWTSEEDYASDGVNPDQGLSGDTFTFRVRYYNPTPGDCPPEKIHHQLWLDSNNNGQYEESEKHQMEPAGSGIYTYSQTIDLAEGGGLSYRFFFNNCYSAAIGEPTEDKTLTIWPTETSIPRLNWVGGESYQLDGVDPDAGSTRVEFNFKVEYQDDRNTPPALAQLWIDLDGNSYYGEGEKYDMEAANSQDNTYSDGKIYQKNLFLSSATTGSLAYRFAFRNDRADATGDPIQDHYLSISSDHAPTLSEASVEPGSADGGSEFNFEVTYIDQDNEPPFKAGVLWIDLNDDQNMQANEKFTLTEKDPSQQNYIEGKVYQVVSKQIFSAGDGELEYQFIFDEATGPGTSPVTAFGTVTVNEVGYSPELSWVTYTHGVDHEIGNADEEFIFKVKYEDKPTDPPDPRRPNGDPPYDQQVWVDENGDGLYQSYERHFMTEQDPNDHIYSDGKIYTLTLPLNPAGSGQHRVNYLFYFRDDKNLATGDPVRGWYLDLNHKPVLESGQVSPAEGKGGDLFTFRVVYRDEDNDPAINKKVWVDENGDGIYESSEKHQMERTEDKDFKEGVKYEPVEPLILSYVSNDPISYGFHFSDGYIDVNTPDYSLQISPAYEETHCNGLDDDGDASTLDNHAPQLEPIPPQMVRVGQSITFNPQAYDPDGDGVSFVYSGWMDSHSYTPVLADVGTHWVTIKAQDDCVNSPRSDKQTVLVMVIGSGTIKGVIKGNGDVSQATIQIEGVAQTEADENGSFVFSNLLPGRYELIVSARGYEKKTTNITLSSGQTAEIDIQLTPVRIGEIAGRVIDENDSPLPGISVVATSMTGKPVPYSTKTDLADGSYHLYLPGGVFKVAAFDPNCQFKPTIETNNGEGFIVDPNIYDPGLVNTYPNLGNTRDPNAYGRLELKMINDQERSDRHALQITSIEKWSDSNQSELITKLFFYPQGRIPSSIALDQMHDVQNIGIPDAQAHPCYDEEPVHYEATYSQYYDKNYDSPVRVGLICTLNYNNGEKRVIPYQFYIHPQSEGRFPVSRVELETNSIEAGHLGPIGFTDSKVFDHSRVDISAYSVWGKTQEDLAPIRVCLERRPDSVSGALSRVYDLQILGESTLQVNQEAPLTTYLQIDLEELLTQQVYQDANSIPLDDLEVRYQDNGTWKIDGIDHVRLHGENDGKWTVAFLLRHNSLLAVFQSTPDNLTAEAQSDSKIKLSWRDNSLSETGFEIWRRKWGSFKRVAQVKPDTTSYTDSGLEPQQLYQYKVRAKTSRGGFSSFSNLVQEKTLTQSTETGGVSGGGSGSSSGGGGGCFISAIRLIP